MESAGGEEADRRRWLAVKDHVHQHQLDSRHPPHGTCAHACPSDGKFDVIILFFKFRKEARRVDVKDGTAKTPIFL